MVSLSARGVLSGPLPFYPYTFDELIYGGQSYVAASDGEVNITSPSVVIDGLVTAPFSLYGWVHGDSLTAGSVDLEFIGSGTSTALYRGPCPDPFPCDYPSWTLVDLQYDIEPPPIPEPASWMLLGSGLLGMAARRRSARRNR